MEAKDRCVWYQESSKNDGDFNIHLHKNPFHSWVSGQWVIFFKHTRCTLYGMTMKRENLGDKE
jgi:hypothetical protein